MAVVVLPTPPLVFTTAIFKTHYTSICKYRHTAVRIVVYTLVPTAERRSLLDTPSAPKYRRTDIGVVVYTATGLYRALADLHWKPTGP